MYIFIIAILISFVLRYISGFVVKLYLSLEKTEKELSDSFIFNICVLTYVINTGLIVINVTVLASLLIKTYLL